MTNLFKKVASGVIAMAVVASSAINVGTISAQYVSAEFSAAYSWLAENSITSMPTEETFAPFSVTTREQFAAFVTRGMSVIEDQCDVELITVDAEADCSFGDSASFDPTLVGSINAACNAGLMKGYNDNFWPTQYVTRAQAMTVFGRALYGQQEEPAQYWSNYYTLLNADGIFTIENASANFLRYQAALVLYRIAQDECGTDDNDDLDDILCQLLGTCDDVDDDDTDDDDDNDNVAIDGTIQVAVSASSPSSMKVPENAIVNAAAYDFTAGTEEVAKVYSMTVSMVGLTNNCTLDSIAAFGPNGRITNARSFNSDKEATLSFIGGVNIAPGATTTIRIVADTLKDTCLAGAAQSTEFAFDIVEVNANADVAYGVTKSATHEILNVTAAQLKVKADGTPADVSIGDKAVEVAKFTFEGDNNNDLEVNEITLRDDENTADRAFENFELWCDGDMVGSLFDTPNSYVTIMFDAPLFVEEGKDVDCKLVADVIAEPNEEFRFFLDNTLDVAGIDLDFNGAGIGIMNEYDVTDTNKVLIEAGDLTISKINLDVDEVRSDYDDFIIADMEIVSAAGGMVEWRDVSFDIDGTDPICDYLEESEFELWNEDTGSRYSLDVDGTCDGDISISDDDVSIMLAEGTTHFTVRTTTVDDAAFAGSTFNVSWNRVDNDFREINDDEEITDVTPSTVSWRNVTIVDSGLALTILPAGSVNAVIGFQDLTVIDFQLETADYNDVVIDELRVDGATVDGLGAIIGDINEDQIAGAYLYRVEDDDSLTLIDSESDIVAGVIDFDNLDEMIDADTDAKYTVLVDIVDDATQAGIKFKFGVSYVDADDDQNNPVYVAQDVNKDKTLDAVAYSTRVVTISSVGTLDASTDNGDTEVSVPELVLGGAYSDIVASFELTASDEDIEIKDLVIAAAGGAPTFASHVKEVQIYDEDMNLIDTKVVTDDTVEFDNINYTVEQGTENLYIVVKAQTIGYGKPGQQSVPLTLTLDITEADGVDSGDPIVVGGNSSVTASQSFSVVPVLISNVVASNTNCVSTACTLNLTTTDTAKFKVTAANTTNTTLASPGQALETVLNDLTFELTTSNVASAVYTLKRINATNTANNSIVGTVSGNTLTFADLETTSGTWSADNAEIDGTVEFKVVVSSVTETNAAVDTEVSLSFDTSNSSSVVYSSDDVGAAPINYILGGDEDFGTWENDN